jgi:hypothetical protein
VRVFQSIILSLDDRSSTVLDLPGGRQQRSDDCVHAHVLLRLHPELERNDQLVPSLQNRVQRHHRRGKSEKGPSKNGSFFEF